MDQALQNFKQTFGPQALADLVFTWTPGVIAAVANILIFVGIIWTTTRVLEGVFDMVARRDAARLRAVPAA